MWKSKQTKDMNVEEDLSGNKEKELVNRTSVDNREINTSKVSYMSENVTMKLTTVQLIYTN